MATAQTKITNKYGLIIIKSTKILQKEINEHPEKKMMDIKSFIPGIILDLKYATDQNFMHQKLYPKVTTTFLKIARQQRILRKSSKRTKKRKFESEDIGCLQALLSN